MYSSNEWYVSDGSVLIGEEANKHLNSKLNDFMDLIDEVELVLNEALERNHVAEEETLHSVVMSTGEALSITQLELELLLERMVSVLKEF